MKKAVVLAIVPGKLTGIAAWCPQDACFIHIKACSIHSAFDIMASTCKLFNVVHVILENSNDTWLGFHMRSKDDRFHFGLWNDYLFEKQKNGSIGSVELTTPFFKCEQTTKDEFLFHTKCVMKTTQVSRDAALHCYRYPINLKEVV